MDGLEYIFDGEAFPQILNDLIDAGFIEGVIRWTGHSAQRISPGYDTNNSTNDFEVMETLTPGYQTTSGFRGSGYVTVPTEIRLHPSYPNPFNSGTVIPFEIAERTGDVRLVIANVLGRTVKEFRFEGVGTGNYTVHWDGNNQNGLPVSSGNYFIQLYAAPEIATGKVTLLR